MKKKSAFKVFLSFISADRESAERLQAILLRRDDVQVVPAEIRGSENLQPKLLKQLQDSNLFVVVVSPDSLSSPWIIQELGAAWGSCKAIVPVKTRPDVELPVRLDGLISFELKDVLTPDSWNRILEAFQGAKEGDSFNFLTANPLLSSH